MILWSLGIGAPAGSLWCMAPAAVAGVEMHLLFLSLLEAFLGQVLGGFGDQFGKLV